MRDAKAIFQISLMLKVKDSGCHSSYCPAIIITLKYIFKLYGEVEAR
jgi:hypothetical protein